MVRNFLFFLSFVSIIACGSKPRVDLGDEKEGFISPSVQHTIIAKEVATILESYSYKKVAMNDSISSIVFDNLIKALDQRKVYLLKKDVDEMEKFRNHISQDFKNGDLSAPFYMFNLYKERYLESMNYALEELEKDVEFDSDEYLISNREKLDWFETEEELKDQWRKRIKYDLLNLKLAREGSKDVDDEEEENKDEKGDPREVLRKRYKNLISQAEKYNANDAFQIIMSSFTDAVDPHTTYYNPSFAQAFNESMSNTFEGIGARLMIDNEMVTINEIIPGGPAFKDKSLEIGDRIIGVAQGKESFEDIIGWRLDAAVAKIKGPKGTVVRLKILPVGQEIGAEPKIVSLKREQIVLEEESAKKEIKTVKGTNGKEYKIGVIKLPKFYIDFSALRRNDPNYKSTTRDVNLILDTLKQENVDAVVIDLRNNGGGSLQEAISLTGLFTGKGPVVQVKDIKDRVDVENNETTDIAWNGPLGVLINRFSASASEIFAGAIQDYGRGVIFGSQSFGKGTVQNAVDMGRFISPSSKLLMKAAGKKDPDTPSGAPEYGQINVTMGKFYRVTGSSTQHKGVSADISFPSQFSAEKFGESSEPSALPWDQIKSASFKKKEDLSELIEKIKINHKKNMENSAEYKFLLEDIERFNDSDTTSRIPLNAQKLKAERDENNKKNRDRINKILAAHNQPLWKEGEPRPKMDFDLVLDESLNLMITYIEEKRANTKE